MEGKASKATVARREGRETKSMEKAKASLLGVGWCRGNCVYVKERGPAGDGERAMEDAGGEGGRLCVCVALWQCFKSPAKTLDDFKNSYSGAKWGYSEL